ncbi:MAG: VRR-NUC domain-containing protein [Acidimicrobiia bacterium]
MFIREGRVVFIEFKTEKGKLTSGQEREIERLKNAGCEVHACRSLDEVKGVLGG